MSNFQGRTLGFATSLGLILWPFFTSLGLLLAIGYWGGLGFLAFMTVSLSLVYYLNKARRHSRPDNFDDRLTTARMEEARAWLISNAETLPKNPLD